MLLITFYQSIFIKEFTLKRLHAFILLDFFMFNYFQISVLKRCFFDIDQNFFFHISTEGKSIFFFLLTQKFKNIRKTKSKKGKKIKQVHSKYII